VGGLRDLGGTARAHLNEFPDYYTRPAKMEAEAQAEANGSAPSE
jgi:hypothetical protein